MKLGTETGSLMNHLHARATMNQPVPEVGMGATILCWTDRHAGTIASVERVRNAVIVGVRRDKSRVVAGSSFDGSAEYAYEPNPDATVEYWRADSPDGQWRKVVKGETGRWKLARSGNGLKIGVRDEYRDPHF